MTTYDFATKTLGKYCDPGSLYRGFETRHFRHSYGRAAVSSTSCLRGPARRPHISGLLVRSLDSGPEVVTPFSHGLLWPIRRLTLPLPQNVMSATGPTQASVISPAYVLFQPDRNVHMSELRVLLFRCPRGLNPSISQVSLFSSAQLSPSRVRPDFLMAPGRTMVPWQLLHTYRMVGWLRPGVRHQLTRSSLAIHSIVPPMVR